MALTETVWREVNFGPSAVSLQATNVWYRVTDAVTGVPGAWQQGGVSQILNRSGGATGAFNILLPFDPTVSYAMDWDGNNGQYFASETIDPEIVATIPLPLWRQVGAGAAAASIPASAAYYQVRKADGTYALTWSNTGVVAVTNRAGNPTGYFRAVLTLDPSISYVTQWDINSGQFTASEENDSLTGTSAAVAAGHYTSQAAIELMAPIFADQISQTDNSSTAPNTTRYQAAITSIETWMDTQLRIYGYPAPLLNTSNLFSFAQDVATKDALVELYQSPRGFYDAPTGQQQPGGQLAMLRYAAKYKYTEGGMGVRDQWIDLLRSGSLDVAKGDAMQTSPISTIPAPRRWCGYAPVSGVYYG